MAKELEADKKSPETDADNARAVDTSGRYALQYKKNERHGEGTGWIMLLIGICGASGSGKTTLADELMRRLNTRAILLHQDSYYRNHPDMSFEERRLINYDEPAAFDNDALYEDLCLLKAGRPITEKQYDYTRHLRCDTGAPVEPASTVIIEGIHVFYDPRVRDLLDLKLYIKVDPDICLLRRVQRDIAERERRIDDIARQYLSTVKPMFEQYIRGYERDADIIVARGGKSQRIADALACYINNGGMAEEQGEQAAPHS